MQPLSRYWMGKWQIELAGHKFVMSTLSIGDILEAEKKLQTERLNAVLARLSQQPMMAEVSGAVVSRVFGDITIDDILNSQACRVALLQTSFNQAGSRHQAANLPYRLLWDLFFLLVRISGITAPPEAGEQDPLAELLDLVEVTDPPDLAVSDADSSPGRPEGTKPIRPVPQH